MKRTRLTRAMAFCLAALLLLGTFGISASADVATGSSGMTGQALKELLNADSYTKYDSKYPSNPGTGEVTVDAADLAYYSDGETVYFYDRSTQAFYTVASDGGRTYVDASAVAAKIDTYGGKQGLYSPSSGTLSWEITVPTTGRYAIEIEYYPLGETVSSIERMFYIDGKVPFSQARYLTFSKIWAYDYPTDDAGNATFKEDVNGNQLRPGATLASEWTTRAFQDPDGFYQRNFEFYFTEGTHTISLESSREAMAIKSIRIFPNDKVPTYAETLETYRANGWKPAGSDAALKIEGEKPYRVSDTSVYASSDRSSAINSPTSASAQLLNVMGASGYNTVGQWASYQFTPTKTGLYTISMRCKQDQLAGMYTSRAVKLAGGIYGDTLDVPFAEAYNARFDYDKSWQIATLGDGTNVFQFYFEEGVTYTLSLEVSLGSLAGVIEQVESSLDVINACYLEILKLTGTEPDEYRDYNFSRVMPTTIINLGKEYRNLTAVSEELTALAGSRGSHVATLDRVALLLRTMCRDESKIAENLENLKSYIGTLGTWLNTSKQQSLTLDYLVVQGTSTAADPYAASVDVALGDDYKANASFFETAGFEISSFFNSFLIDYNSMGVTDAVETNTSVEVWLATDRDQASIWRNLVDSTFTSTDAGAGIAVDLKLVAGGSLLPSVLAKQGPDVYMGLGSGDVINYAIRSAVLPVTEYVDAVQADGTTYRDTTLNVDFNEATLVPISMYDQLYGLPNAVSFSMMFYRKDVLANLDLDVPRTWDDLLTCVPVLQASNMQIGLSRDYNLFLYQSEGGDRWYYDGTNYEGTKYADLMSDPTFATYFDYMGIAYGEDVALEAFKYMCRFYTDYSFPVSYDAANRFRTGEMPIVIADAVSMYNQLTVFATEIRGLWMFTNVPGTPDSDGNINNCAVAGVSAVVMMNGVEDEAASWQYMKWMVSPDVQSECGNNMVFLIGPSAKYNTANMNALFKMSWTSEELTNLVSQFNNLATIPNYPGAYIIDRYLNFAFLNAYNDGADPVDQLQGYIKTIDKEISRKREEFDLPTLEDGKTIDDSITAYLAYLQGLEDDALRELGFSDYVINYVRSHT